MNEVQKTLRAKIAALLDEYASDDRKTWEGVDLREWAEKMASSVGNLLADEESEALLARDDDPPPPDVPARVVGRREGYVMGIDAAARELSVLATAQLDAAYEGPMHMAALRLHSKAQREAQRYAIDSITGDYQRDEAHHVGDHWESSRDGVEVIGIRFPLPVVLKLRREDGSEFDCEPHVLEKTGYRRVQ